LAPLLSAAATPKKKKNVAFCEDIETKTTPTRARDRKTGDRSTCAERQQRRKQNRADDRIDDKFYQVHLDRFSCDPASLKALKQALYEDPRDEVARVSEEIGVTFRQERSAFVEPRPTIFYVHGMLTHRTFAPVAMKPLDFCTDTVAAQKLLAIYRASGRSVQGGIRHKYGYLLHLVCCVLGITRKKMSEDCWMRSKEVGGEMHHRAESAFRLAHFMRTPESSIHIDVWWMQWLNSADLVYHLIELLRPHNIGMFSIPWSQQRNRPVQDSLFKDMFSYQKEYSRFAIVAELEVGDDRQYAILALRQCSEGQQPLTLQYTFDGSDGKQESLLAEFGEALGARMPDVQPKSPRHRRTRLPSSPSWTSILAELAPQPQPPAPSASRVSAQPVQLLQPAAAATTSLQPDVSCAAATAPRAQDAPASHESSAQSPPSTAIPALPAPAPFVPIARTSSDESFVPETGVLKLNDAPSKLHCHGSHSRLPQALIDLLERKASSHA
jgi:hypothetical protein